MSLFKKSLRDRDAEAGQETGLNSPLFSEHLTLGERGIWSSENATETCPTDMPVAKARKLPLVRRISVVKGVVMKPTFSTGLSATDRPGLTGPKIEVWKPLGEGCSRRAAYGAVVTDQQFNVVPQRQPGAIPIRPIGPGDWRPPGTVHGVGTDLGQRAYVDVSDPRAVPVIFENVLAMSLDPGSPMWSGPPGPPPGGPDTSADDDLLLLL
ncbi:hypothetical protein [Nocardioides sp. KR10-350]|uniref:hypothetical protein n=1 Tax=Nocardioides cheoyonin TaxID=3156615 RepID=UPI0032B51D82